MTSLVLHPVCHPRVTFVRASSRTDWHAPSPHVSNLPQLVLVEITEHIERSAASRASPAVVAAGRGATSSSASAAGTPQSAALLAGVLFGSLAGARVEIFKSFPVCTDVEVTVTLPAGRDLKEHLSSDAADELLGLIAGVLSVPVEAFVIHMNGIQIQLTPVFSGETVSAYTVDFVLNSDAAAASPVIRATGAPTVAAGVKSALVAASVAGAFKGPGKALADSLGLPLNAFSNTPPTFLRVSPFNTQLLLKTLALSTFFLAPARICAPKRRLLPPRHAPSPRHPSAKDVFPSFEVLGWYAVSDAASSAEIDSLHRAFSVLREGDDEAGKSLSPFLVQLMPSLITPSLKSMPLKVRLGEKAGEDGVIAWADVEFVIEATGVERSCIDFVTAQQTLRGGSGGVSSSALEKRANASPTIMSLQSTATALRVLQERLSTLHRYVDACMAGNLPPPSSAGASSTRAALRKIDATLSRLPVIVPPSLAPALARENTDALMIALAASTTDGAAGLSALTARFEESRLKDGEQRESRAFGGHGGMGALAMRARREARAMGAGHGEATT